MQSKLFAAGMAVALGSAIPAQAQVTLDVSKVTCDQYVHNKVGTAKTVAAWLSGYYHGKNNSLTVDLSTMETMAEKLQTFCYEEKNWTVPVMQAVERVAR